MKSNKATYKKIFENCDPNERALVERLIEEVLHYEDQLTELKKLPFIAVNPKNSAQQKATAAAKLYKDLMAQYMNAIRILINVLRKNDTSAADLLIARLDEFT